MKMNNLILPLALATALGFGSNVFAAANPTDPEIAHIVVTANSIDVSAGKYAESHAKNKEVKEFAKRMVTDHTGVNKQAVALAKKLHVTPKNNEISKSLEAGAKENMANLKSKKGKDFDRAYIDHEVAYHQAVLDTIDQTLVPNAQNEELKALIVKVRPAIEAHLEHAKKIQKEME